MAKGPTIQTEPTPEGEQAVIEGVQPLTLRDRLQFQAGLPLQTKRPQRLCNLGLFDLDARRQVDWLDELRKPNPFAGTGEQTGPFRAFCKTRRKGPSPLVKGAFLCNCNTSNSAS